MFIPDQIDYKRLYEVTNLLLTSPLGVLESYRGIGKTFARMHLMLQQSYINPSYSSYLFITNHSNHARGAARAFYDLVQKTPESLYHQPKEFVRLNHDIFDKSRNNRYVFISYEYCANNWIVGRSREPSRLALIDVDQRIVSHHQNFRDYDLMLQRLYSRNIRCV